MSKADDSYARHRGAVDELSDLVRRGKHVFTGLEMNGWAETADRVTQRLSSDRFRVIILGEFKRGKSTFINALLGREILPAFATPCTAIINEVKWGQEPRAILHFRNPPPAPLPRSLPREALAHIERHRARTIPPLQVPVGDLERFVVIPDPAKNQADSIAETPYDFVEIFWPLSLLQNGVEIIDSPGLNEHGSRTKITMDYLGKIDAVIFVFSVHALGSQTELAVIDNDVRSAGHEYIFFVCNRFDELRRQERDRIVGYSYEQLAPRTAMAREGVFFISALDAVIGREENKPDLVERSNVPALETALARFLVNERGRIKLLQPARLLAQGTKAALFETIPNQRKMLAANIADLEERYAKAQPQLAEADTRRQTIVARIERSRIRLRDAIRDSASLHFREIAMRIPGWVSSLNLESRIQLFKFKRMEEQITELATEIVREVSPLIEQETAEWRERQLQPMVNDMLEELNEAANNSVRDFLIDLENIRTDLSQLGSRPAPAQNEISPLERVLSGAGGFIIGGAGSAIEGATMGYQGMLRSLMPQIMLAAAGIMILNLNPVTLVAAMVAMGLFRTFKQGNALTDREIRNRQTPFRYVDSWNTGTGQSNRTICLRANRSDGAGSRRRHAARNPIDPRSGASRPCNQAKRGGGGTTATGAAERSRSKGPKDRFRNRRFHSPPGTQRLA